MPAGALLAEHIAAEPGLVAGKRVLELGSGCGLAGLTAAATGAAHVLLTDTEPALANLRVNIQANKQSAAIPAAVVAAQVLEWGDEEAVRVLRADSPPFDLVILSDCTYWSHLFERLLSTLKLLAAAYDNLKIILVPTPTPCPPISPSLSCRCTTISPS